MADKFIRFGTVGINILTIPQTFEEFEAKYKGKVPDLAEAWKVCSKYIKVEDVEKPIKKKRKKYDSNED